MAERASCYDACQNGHNCFGGWLCEDLMCDKEIERIKGLLESRNPGKRAFFAPADKIGLRFVMIESQQWGTIYRLDEGELALFDNK
jgi:hypothetical protein